jgi:hypothetical protein
LLSQQQQQQDLGVCWVSGQRPLFWMLQGRQAVTTSSSSSRSGSGNWGCKTPPLVPANKLFLTQGRHQLQEGRLPVAFALLVLVVLVLVLLLAVVRLAWMLMLLVWCGGAPRAWRLMLCWTYWGERTGFST